MKVLAIECSAKAVSAAIANNGKLISESFLNIKLTHSETLMPLINQVLNNSKNNLDDIDAFAVTAGPGSFTGIRIGVSAVKGLAFANEKPVYPYSSLEAAVYGNTSYNCIICSLMDARGSRYYTAFFEVNKKNVTRISKDDVLSQNDLENEIKIKYNNKKIVLVGDGAESFLEKADLINADLAPENNIIQRASGIAIHCSSKHNNISPVSPEMLQPVYLIKSQAEREHNL